MSQIKLSFFVLIFFLGNVFACSPYNGHTDKENRTVPEKKTDTLSSRSIPEPSTPKDSLATDSIKTVDKETTKKVDIRYIRKSINLHKRPLVAQEDIQNLLLAENELTEPRRNIID